MLLDTEELETSYERYQAAWDSCPPNKKPHTWKGMWYTFLKGGWSERGASSSGAFPGLEVDRGAQLRVHITCTKVNQMMGSLLPTASRWRYDLQIWATLYVTSTWRRSKITQQKGIHLLIFKVWAVTQVDCSLSLPHPHLCLEGHKHKRQGGKRWRKRRPHPIVPFMDPTQRARIENVPEMKLRPE